jgi:hypothetical protein
MEKQGILLGGIQGLTPKEALNAFKNDKMASNPNIIRVVETKNSDGTSIWFCHYVKFIGFMDSIQVPGFSEAERAVINEETKLTPQLFFAIIVTAQRIVNKTLC